MIPKVRSIHRTTKKETRTLREDMGKIPFCAVLRINSPKSILDVPFCHKNSCIILRFGKRMDDAGQQMTELVDRAFRCCLHCRRVDRWDYLPSRQAQVKGQVQDGTKLL